MRRTQRLQLYLSTASFFYWSWLYFTIKINLKTCWVKILTGRETDARMHARTMNDGQWAITKAPFQGIVLICAKRRSDEKTTINQIIIFFKEFLNSTNYFPELIICLFVCFRQSSASYWILFSKSFLNCEFKKVNVKTSGLSELM